MVQFLSSNFYNKMPEQLSGEEQEAMDTVLTEIEEMTGLTFEPGT